MRGAAQVPVARRNILADKRRLSIAVVGVGAALGLIFLLEGLWKGFQVQCIRQSIERGESEERLDELMVAVSRLVRR